MGAPVTLTDPEGNYVEISGGGSVTVTNFPATQAVSSTAFGAPADAAWSGTGNGSVIAILKAIHAQNVTAISLLAQIRDNTAAS